MIKLSATLFQRFDINLFSQKHLPEETLEAYYQDSLRLHNRRTRSDSKISCHNMVIFLLLWVLHPEDGYRSVLNKAMGFLFQKHDKLAPALTAITDAGLCKARKRFSSEIWRKIWRLKIVVAFYKEKGEKLWQGLQVAAVDGTSFTLTKSKEILAQFPVNKGSKLPKMLACVLYDVYAKIPLDVAFSKFPGNERTLLFELIKRANPIKMLLLLDRGYPAYWVFFKLLDLKSNFVIRVTSLLTFTTVKVLGPNDRLVKLSLTKSMRNAARKFLSDAELQRMPKTVTVRLIQTQMKGFRPRWILTSLLDDNTYSYAEICKLYCDRWIIENYYRDFKHILKVEKFHSHYVDGIYQEIYAALILTVVLQEYILAAAQKAGVPFEEISFKRTFQIFADFLYIIEFAATRDQTRSVHELLLALIALNRQKRRPRRSYKRIFYKKIKCSSKSK